MILRILALGVLWVGMGVYGQETNGVTSRVVERDVNKDGKPEFRVETVSRDGKKIMVVWSKPNQDGALVVSSRSYFAGGEMVASESDGDKDGNFETMVVYRAGSEEVEVFRREKDGAVIPVSDQQLAAYKKQFGALSDFWDKALDKGTDVDTRMERFKETRKAIQEAELEKKSVRGRGKQQGN